MCKKQNERLKRTASADGYITTLGGKKYKKKYGRSSDLKVSGEYTKE